MNDAKGNYMPGTYKSRAHQLRAFEQRVKSGELSLRKALKNAAIAGACEERERTLRLITKVGGVSPLAALHTLYKQVCSVAISEVLGYPPKAAKRAREGCLKT